MVNAYKAVDWQPDMVVTRDLMNTMNANAQWIYENSPRGRFIRDPSGLESRSTRLVVVSGRVIINKSKKSPRDGKKVKFGAKMFSNRCAPSVTLGVQAPFPVHTFVNGLGKKLQPQDNGFEIRVFVPGNSGKKWLIPKNFRVYWSATGWRDD